MADPPTGQDVKWVDGRRFVDDLLTGFLHNAAARHQAVAQLAPSAPSDGYLTGYGDGWEAGQVAGLRLP